MSNWDLMMPGMGLTAIGLAGVTVSYAGIAHTFIDGMHALTGLTMFIGLIFLAAGILDGGVSTSNRAKATTLVVLGISLSFAVAAFNFTTITTLPTFAGVMLIVAIPAIVIAYAAMKIPEYAKPISIIFILAVGAAIAAYVGFGLYGPSPYLIPPPVPIEEPVGEQAETAPVFAISILKGSATQGNPDYEPDEAHVPLGSVIEWTNDDDVSHTVTSSADAGDTFNSNLFDAGQKYRLDTSTLAPGKYDYLCIVHPWMTASFELVEGQSADRLTEGATATDPNSIPVEETPVEEPQITEPKSQAPEVLSPADELETPLETEAPAEEPTQDDTVIISIPLGTSVPGCEKDNACFIPSEIRIGAGTTITWTNDDTAAHTVTSGDTKTGPIGQFDSGLFMAGKSFSFTFEAKGQYPYYCQVHPWMIGKVTVE